MSGRGESGFKVWRRRGVVIGSEAREERRGQLVGLERRCRTAARVGSRRRRAADAPRRPRMRAAGCALGALAGWAALAGGAAQGAGAGGPHAECPASPLQPASSTSVRFASARRSWSLAPPSCATSAREPSLELQYSDPAAAAALAKVRAEPERYYHTLAARCGRARAALSAAQAGREHGLTRPVRPESASRTRTVTCGCSSRRTSVSTEVHILMQGAARAT